MTLPLSSVPALLQRCLCPKRSVVWGLTVIVAGLLAGCNEPGPQLPPEAGAGAAGTSAQPLTPPRQFGGGSETPVALHGGATGHGGIAAPEVVLGSGQFVSPQGAGPAPQPIALVGSDVTLDFTNADVRDVLKSVLGDLLKLNYTVDPAVQGTITLQTGRPIPRSSVVDVLNTTLGLSGIALVDRDGLYLAVPVANAVRQAQTDASVGFVTRIVPLEYVAANDLLPALEPLTPPGATIKADPLRNILIVSGSARDVSGIMANIATFDVDTLRGLSFALLPLTSGKAKDVAVNVTSLLTSSGPSVANMVKVVPIERMNAILVTSLQPSYLERVRGWVERFDRGDGRGDQQLFVYRVQNGRATDIARVLRRALGIGGDNGSSGDQAEATPSDSDTTPPAAGTTSPSGLSTVQSALSGGTAPAAPTPGSPQLKSDALASVGAAAALAGGGGTGGEPTTDVRVTADNSNNAIIITATAQEYGPIQAAIQKLDIPPLQVLIDATVAEVTLTNQLSYGLQYFFSSGNYKGIFTPNIPPAATTPVVPSSILPSFPSVGILQGVNLAYSAGGTNVILQVLSAMTTVRVLSSPNLLVLNNGTARLQVGDQVPIATQSATSTLTNTAQTVNSINYKDTGVILNITPRVNASGLVLLDMTEEISQATSTTTSSLSSPTISQRKVTSSVAVHDGQTIGLAGLIQDNVSTANQGIPYLKDLPVIGGLFGFKNNTTTRTELLMLVTPHVIRNQVEGDEVTEELRQKLRLTVPVAARARP